MTYSAVINEPYCYVEVYRVSDVCEDPCNCGEWVGSFGFEQSGTSATIHTWNFQTYDWRAAEFAVKYFREKWVKKNGVTTMFVERSHADRFWMNLGWDVVGKCEMLVKRSDDCT